MTYIKIKDHPTLVRDSESKGILNINVEGKKAFLSRREELRSLRSSLKEQDKLKEDIKEIKEQLSALINYIKTKED